MDLVVDGMDFPGGEGIAKRLAPPDAQAGDPMLAMQNAQNMQAQMADMQAQLEEANKANMQLQMTIQQNVALELEKAKIKSQTDIAIKTMEINANMQLANIKEAGQNERLAAQIIADTNTTNQKIAVEAAKEISKIAQQPAPVTYSEQMEVQV